MGVESTLIIVKLKIWKKTARTARQKRVDSEDTKKVESLHSSSRVDPMEFSKEEIEHLTMKTGWLIGILMMVHYNPYINGLL